MVSRAAQRGQGRPGARSIGAGRKTAPHIARYSPGPSEPAAVISSSVTAWSASSSSTVSHTNQMRSAVEGTANHFVGELAAERVQQREYRDWGTGKTRFARHAVHAFEQISRSGGDLKSAIRSQRLGNGLRLRARHEMARPLTFTDHCAVWLSCTQPNE